MKKFDVIIIKLGALGDVVRTSYLVDAYIKRHNLKDILWITSPNSVDLISKIPNVLVMDTTNTFTNLHTSKLFSLDDEPKSLEIASKIVADELVGAYLDTSNSIKYTENSSAWFDMGLVSIYGKKVADDLKKQNSLSHAQIFSKIFGLDIQDINPVFYGDIDLNSKWEVRRRGADFVLGVNPFAGTRWPSKELLDIELCSLLSKILEFLDQKKINFKIVIFCDETNCLRAENITKDLNKIEIWDTREGVMNFASAISNCDYLISADSLGLHLAIAQSVPNLSFYAPTSAAEIDTFGMGIKVISTASDYCTYQPLVDNSSLTSDRIFNQWINHIKKIGLVND